MGLAVTDEQKQRVTYIVQRGQLEDIPLSADERPLLIGKREFPNTPKEERKVLRLDDEVMHLSGRCSPYFVNFKFNAIQLFWQAMECEGAIEAIVDAEVVEVGCGGNTGLFPSLEPLGIKSYTGIDINKACVKNSNALVHPDYKRKARFIHADPVQYLGSRSAPLLVMSSLVLDDIIMPDENYVRELARAIARVTPLGSWTMHNGILRREVRILEESGFVQPELSDDYCRNSGHPAFIGKRVTS